jgi:cytochrome P450
MDAPEVSFDPYDATVLRDPYPSYARLRDTAPVVRSVIDGRPVWMLSHDHTVRAVLADWRTFSSVGGLSLHPRGRYEAGVLISTDPRRPQDPATQPDHTDLRRAVTPHLGPRALEQIRRPVQSWVHRIVGDLVAAGRFDAVQDLARVVATRVIADLVGIPASDRHLAADWAAAATARQGPRGAVSTQTVGHLQAMRSYVGRLGADGDLALSGVGAAVFAAADNGGRIGRDDAASIVWGGLIIAGLHTTIAALSWAIVAAARHPQQWDRYRAWYHAGDPARVTWPDEVLRHEVVFPHGYRTAVIDTDIDGYLIPASARVLVLYGSANHDPSRWAQPETFVLNRAEADQHLGIGWGPHRCLGRHLAHLEIGAVLDALAAHNVVRVRVIDDLTGWAPNAAVRGWARLPVAVEVADRTRRPHISAAI